MKKIILILSLTVFTIGYSQEHQDSSNKEVAAAPKDEPAILNKNELKGNALFLVAGAIEITYERLLNEESGVGFSVFVPYTKNMDINYNITSYYRFYFGKKPAAGFFVEGFGMLDSYTQPAAETSFFSTYVGPEKDVTDFALGFGLGSKWVTQKGFIFEINAGVGRNLFNSEDTDYQIVGRGGIMLGYRF